MSNPTTVQAEIVTQPAQKYEKHKAQQESVREKPNLPQFQVARNNATAQPNDAIVELDETDIDHDMQYVNRQIALERKQRANRVQQAAFTHYTRNIGNATNYWFGLGEDGQAPLAWRGLSGFIAFCTFIVSAILTAAFLSVPYLDMVIVLLFTSAQFTLWYTKNAPPALTLGLFLMFIVSMAFNISGLHVLSKHDFDFGSWRTWVYILIGVMIDLASEPLLLFAITGNFDHAKTPKQALQARPVRQR